MLKKEADEVLLLMDQEDPQQGNDEKGIEKGFFRVR